MVLRKTRNGIASNKTVRNMGQNRDFAVNASYIYCADVTTADGTLKSCEMIGTPLSLSKHHRWNNNDDNEEEELTFGFENVTHTFQYTASEKISNETSREAFLTAMGIKFTQKERTLRIVLIVHYGRNKNALLPDIPVIKAPVQCVKNKSYRCDCSICRPTTNKKIKGVRNKIYGREKRSITLREYW